MKLTQREFSLIELLVVLAMMAILASLISPSLKKTQEAVDLIACSNNNRQIFLAMSTYLNDYQRYTNAMANADWSDRGGITWDDALGMGYDGRNLSLKLAKRYNLQYGDAGEDQFLRQYICPGDRNTRTNSSLHPRSYALNIYQYSGNRDGISNAWTLGERWSAGVHEVPDPTRTMLISEKLVGYLGGIGGAGIANPNWQPSPEPHQEEYNYLFADGHSEKFHKEDTRDLTKGYWSAGKIWTRNPRD
jgi:prepilin-type N-terminal cleavage/methylation domain-containing protein/prepilin-type processing-associated H-X9-DG protein